MRAVVEGKLSLIRYLRRDKKVNNGRAPEVKQVIREIQRRY